MESVDTPNSIVNTLCGKVYKLIGSDNYYYIGTTTSELKNVLYYYRTKSKTQQSKLYDYINKIGVKNIKIELIENCERDCLKTLEQFYLNKSKYDNLCLNHNIKYDYSLGKIYRLICSDGYFYIGSTILTLENRLKNHILSCKLDSKRPLFAHISKIGWENVEIELIENYPCTSKQILIDREDFHIKKLIDNPKCLNAIRAHLSVEEKQEYKKKADRKYYQNNLEQVKEIQKKYYESNKNEIIEQHRVYNELNRDAVNEYHANYRKEHAEERREYSREYGKAHAEECKEARKKYYAQNKEKVLEVNRAYVMQNADKVNAYKREWQRQKTAKESESKQQAREKKKHEREKKKQERIARDEEIHTCACGGTYQAYRQKRHDSSKMHMAFLQKRVSVSASAPAPAPHSDSIV